MLSFRRKSCGKIFSQKTFTIPLHQGRMQAKRKFCNIRRTNKKMTAKKNSLFPKAVFSLSTHFKLLRGAFFEAFAFLDCLTFADFLLHHCAHFQRQAEKRDEALRVFVVVQVAGFEARDAFVVEAVF